MGAFLQLLQYECMNYRPYSRVLAGRYSLDIYLTKNGVKQGGALAPVLFKFALKNANRYV